MRFSIFLSSNPISHTISKLSQIIGRIFAVDTGGLVFNTLVRGKTSKRMAAKWLLKLE